MAPDPGAEPGAQADAEASAEQTPDADGAAKPEDDKKPESPKRRKRSFWRDLAVIVVAALVLTILLKAFVVQVFSIPSGSMENTLLPGERILVSKVVYDFRPIDRGDIVVFSGAGSWDPPTQPQTNWFAKVWDGAINLVGIAGPGTDYVKRVIGIPGDHVACCNAAGQVTVNGVPLSESSFIYPGDAPSEVRFNITVPPGRLWVMGDNRGDSDDSRYRANDPGQGTIPESAVVGRAFLVIWPLDRFSDLPIPNTFEQPALSAAAAVATAPPATLAGGTALAGAGVLTLRRRRRRGPGAGRRKARRAVPPEDN
ncbi:MAG TPA: signal peptidase I [Trebonia sp.]|jgi:signal peptidase I|nr:signal peptidase I [Trebonia sp.]